MGSASTGIHASSSAPVAASTRARERCGIAPMLWNCPPMRTCEPDNANCSTEEFGTAANAVSRAPLAAKSFTRLFWPVSDARKEPPAYTAPPPAASAWTSGAPDQPASHDATAPPEPDDASLATALRDRPETMLNAPAMNTSLPSAVTCVTGPLVLALHAGSTTAVAAVPTFAT